MKALSVRQPWASQIASGEKQIEWRTWKTNYRGPLLICAAKAGTGPEPRGVAICIVDVVDCRWHDDEDCYGFTLANPRPVPQVPVKGKLGLFEQEHPV